MLKIIILVGISLDFLFVELIVRIDDLLVESLPSAEQFRHDQIVRCSIIRNLGRRANHIVGHLPQFISHLYATETAAVAKDKFQRRVAHAVGDSPCHRRDIHPVFACAA